jgi:hypothetical protein
MPKPGCINERFFCEAGIKASNLRSGCVRKAFFGKPVEPAASQKDQ